MALGGVRILGIVGHGGSGKDQFAAYLAEHNFEKLSFADPLRAIAWDLNPIIIDENILGGFDDYQSLLNEHGYEKAKREYPYIRQVLQALGTDAMRKHLTESVWVDAWERNAERILATGKRVVTPDVRFQNEVDRIHELGGVVARIIRPGVVPANEHKSESLASRYPGSFPIYNDSDLENLKEKAEEVSTLLGNMDPVTAQVMADAI